jgi:hypothetical protein
MLDKIPKGYRENLTWRRQILSQARRDLIFRAKVKELFHRDIIFAFNAFFYTLDVRRRPYHHQPFCTYKYQEDKVLLPLVEAINGGEDCPMEKSRDMGASWLVILTFLWFWLDPKGGTDFLLGSRIEDYVDKKGDMRTLLEKARYTLRKLPRWLLPKGFVWKKHDNFMRLQNPETGASITGESNNANFSTGGRYAAVLFDEFAKWEGTDKAAWTAAGDATPCRIPVSTPFGAAGQHYDLVTDPTKKKIRLHWSLHPRKAEGAYCNWPRLKENEDLIGEALEGLIRSPWYDRECQRRSALEIAQELDIDYIGAGRPAFDAKAGKRIGTLLKIGRTPETYYDFNLGGLELIEVGQVRDSEGFLTVFRRPRKEDSYVLGVDVVEGTEDGDYAIVKVLNRRTKDVDASYWSRINEVELARIIKCIADFYKTTDAPWVGVESNGPGLATFDFCYEIYDIENLFMMPVFDSARQSVSFKKGWRTTESSRKVLVSGVKNWLLEKRGWGDSRLCREMTTFVINKNRKPEAKPGCNDDEVLAWGIAIQVDLLAPEVDYVAPQERREDGLPLGIFIPKEDGSPKTLEERCMACALGKQVERENLTQFGSIDPLNGSVEYGWEGN